MNFLRVRRVHFVGIGGVGMSGLAEILASVGLTVTGSDLHEGEETRRLRGIGIPVFAAGHRAEHVAGADVVVYSSAVAEDNPELVAARIAGVPVIKRAEMLAEVMRVKTGIAIAGSHGKTTTTSMTGAILQAAGLDPTIVVGGRVRAMGTNACLGKGEYLVAEADEYDRSFLKLRPVVAVVNNIDLEHLDTYRDLADLNAQAQAWRDTLANQREHRVTRKLPALLVAEERPALLPLGEPYDTDEVRSVVVPPNFRVAFDGNRYSVPWRLAGKPLTLRADADTTFRLAGDACAKRVHLERGRLNADVQPRSGGEAMVFETPHAEAVLKTASELGIRYYRWGGIRYVEGKPLPAQLDLPAGSYRARLAHRSRSGRGGWCCPRPRGHGAPPVRPRPPWRPSACRP